MFDNTHKAKGKFGSSAGDTWGDQAADDLLKVKGKGFRKEMAKKKRASWRGGGNIDMGVNSLMFSDRTRSKPCRVAAGLRRSSVRTHWPRSSDVPRASSPGP